MTRQLIIYRKKEVKSESNREKSNILLVEDNTINQKIIMKLLESIGIRADLAKDGLEAIRLIQTNNYDLVLMDVYMPNMDGLTATRKLRDEGIQIPIIALTATLEEKDIRKCLDAGMNDCLAKPIEKEKLQEMLDKYLYN